MFLQTESIPFTEMKPNVLLQRLMTTTILLPSTGSCGPVRLRNISSLPEFVVARGRDVEKKLCTERSVLNRVEVEHHKRLRDAGILRTVHQVIHTDKEMYSYGVILMHGLFAHGGTDEVGLRLFACYSRKVSVTSISM